MILLSFAFFLVLSSSAVRTLAQPFVAGCWQTVPDGTSTFVAEYSFGNTWPTAALQAWSYDTSTGMMSFGPFVYTVLSQTFDGSTLTINTDLLNIVWTFTTVSPTSLVGTTSSMYGTYPFALMRPTSAPLFCDAVTVPPTPPPTPAPTPAPTPLPTPAPTPAPTPLPTPAPTPEPTPAPTPLPTPQPIGITLPPPGSIVPQDSSVGGGGGDRTSGDDRTGAGGPAGDILSDPNATGGLSDASGSMDIGVIVGCAIGGLLFLIGVVLVVFYVVKKRKSAGGSPGTAKTDKNVAAGEDGTQLQPVYQAPSGISPTLALTRGSEALQPVYAPPSAIGKNPRVSEAIIGTYEAPQLTRTTTAMSFMTGGSSTGELYLPLELRDNNQHDGVVLSRDIVNRPAAPLPPEATTPGYTGASSTTSTVNFGYPNIRH
jgi:hypothetical protein